MINENGQQVIEGNVSTQYVNAMRKMGVTRKKQLEETRKYYAHLYDENLKWLEQRCKGKEARKKST